MNLTHNTTIKTGIYLVVDPAMPKEFLVPRLKEALGTGKICAVQLWDHWERVDDKKAIIDIVKDVCREVSVPLLLNNTWQMAVEYCLDGVHFDQLPEIDLSVIKNLVGDPFLIGLTVGNDLSPLHSKAASAELDYISFCSVFPSASAGTCEIVTSETILEAAKLTDLPVFLSGGINVSSIPKLRGLPFQGIAVISGIMGCASPARAIEEMDDLLIKTKTETL